MTFSDFAKAMHTYCNNGETQVEFVIKLTDKIMGGQPGRAHGEKEYQNPLRSKDERSLLYYFDGQRPISQRDARIILSSIDTGKFEKYVEKYCSEDAQILLVEAFGKIENINEIEEIKELDDKSTPKVCTQLFVKILRDLAEK